MPIQFQGDRSPAPQLPALPPARRGMPEANLLDIGGDHEGAAHSARIHLFSGLHLDGGTRYSGWPLLPPLLVIKCPALQPLCNHLNHFLRFPFLFLFVIAVLTCTSALQWCAFPTMMCPPFLSPGCCGPVVPGEDPREAHAAAAARALDAVCLQGAHVAALAGQLELAGGFLDAPDNPVALYSRQCALRPWRIPSMPLCC